MWSIDQTSSSVWIWCNSCSYCLEPHTCTRAMSSSPLMPYACALVQPSTRTRTRIYTAYRSLRSRWLCVTLTPSVAFRFRIAVFHFTFAQHAMDDLWLSRRPYLIIARTLLTVTLVLGLVHIIIYASTFTVKKVVIKITDMKDTGACNFESLVRSESECQAWPELQ